MWAEKEKRKEKMKRLCEKEGIKRLEIPNSRNWTDTMLCISESYF